MLSETSVLRNAMKKILDKISSHGHFKSTYSDAFDIVMACYNLHIGFCLYLRQTF